MRASPKALTSLTVLTVSLFAVGLLVWPAQLGGSTTYVTTRGISMTPTFHTGDLAIVRPADRYQVGDIAAYRSHPLKALLLHRIVAVDGDRFTFKGDHNSWLDPEVITSSQVVGKLIVWVPQGGTRLEEVRSPVGLALITFLLLASGGAIQTRHRRRKPKPLHRRTTTRSSLPKGATLGTAPPWLRSSAMVTAGLGISGVALAIMASTGPLSKNAATGGAESGSMTFSYTADVPKTAAYDGTTVTSPDPVFRKLADTVDVHFAYQGDPGRMTVSARLSTDSGWHSTVPLGTPTAFTTHDYQGTVRLSLKALEARAQAAAALTGIPATQVTLVVVPRVDTAGGGRFSPALKLSLSQLQLTLIGNAKALQVTDPAAAKPATTTAREIGAFGHHVTVAIARILSIILLLAGIMSTLVLFLFARRSAPTSEAAGIHRRYAALLLPVQPMTTPIGRPLIDVTGFATLARLAERYGLLVMHWTRSGTETFVVQDEGTTYRYRAPVTNASHPMPALTSERVPAKAP
jgi:signal peptidase I